MTATHVLSVDESLETTLEWHFRLGCAVHRVECVLVDVQYAIDTMTDDAQVDLVDMTLRGQCETAARLPALIAVAGSIAATAVTLWDDGPFEDAAVAARLRNPDLRAWLVTCHDAVHYGSVLTPDANAFVSQLFDVIRTMRAYVIRYGRRHFPKRFSAPHQLSMR